MKLLSRLSLALLVVVAGLSSCEKDDGKPSIKGTTGPLTWELTEYGTLNISGEGAMSNFSSSAEYPAPWRPHREKIKVTIIGDSVTKIGNFAFYGCANLVNIAIPNSVTVIGGGAFQDCAGLTDITIPHGVTIIPTWTFYGCSSLTDITIPANVMSIASRAFYGCTDLAAVTCMAIDPPILGYYNFTASGDTLRVPAASLSAYQEDAFWSAAFSSIVAIE